MGESVQVGVAADGSTVVQAGRDAVVVQVGQVRSGQSARSAYLRQVRGIAPDELRDRAAELAELARFCSATGAGGYWWYRAPAWAGKSALLAWFVVNPPAGVRVVSFFVTSRLPQHGDLSGFIAVVLEQLCDLLHRPVPGPLTDATSGAHLLAMLDEAAEHCQARGERLVLVVDGLDEDLGVTVGPTAHSIAAMLPESLVAGLRVVVSARPRPPVPDDVPDGHPLRDPAIVHELSPSAHADVVRVDAQRELARWLHGTELELDLLGLLVAAGGGLTVRDLAELTGGRPRLIGEHLRTATGRTFVAFPPRWRTGAENYRFAHDTLLKTASHELSGAELGDRRTRLRAWAGGYRDRGWPVDTPEYLLADYPKTFHPTDDRAQVLALAIDRTRHNRMVDVTGSDVLALTEITAALDTACGATKTDLTAIARLAVHRDALTGRNATIPTDLPGLWFDLGEVEHAETLALGITPAHRQRDALLDLIVRHAAGGHRDRAELLAARLDDLHAAPRAAPEAAAEAAEWSSALVHAWAAAGRFDRAMTAMSAITDLRRWIQALTTLAECSPEGSDRAAVLAEAARLERTAGRALHPALLALFAALGEVEPAERVWPAQGLVWDQAACLWHLARAVPDPARHPWLHHIALSVAQELTAPGELSHGIRCAAVVAVARALALIGDRPAAVVVLRAAAALPTHTDRSANEQDEVLRHLAEALAEVAEVEFAEEVARRITWPFGRAIALARVAGVTAAAAHGRARTLVRDAESAARAGGYTGALLAVARAHSAVGNRDSAVALASEVLLSHRSARHRLTVPQATAMAEGFARMGNHTTADRLVRDSTKNRDRAEAYAKVALATREPERAWDIARSINDSRLRAETLTRITRTVVATGDLDLAERIATSIRRSASRSQACAVIVDAAAAGGDLDRCHRLLRVITDPWWRARATTAIALARTKSGDHADAVALVAAIENSDFQAEGWLRLVERLVEDGHVDAANLALVKAQECADQSAHREWRTWTRLRIVQTVANAAGHPDESAHLSRKAVELAGQLGESSWESLVTVGDGMVYLVEAAVRVGDLDRAASLAHSIEDPTDRDLALERVVNALLVRGDVERATALARTAPYDFSRAARLATVAAALLATGPSRPAEALVTELTHLPDRSLFWRTLAAATPGPRAARFVAHALQCGPWHESIPELLRVAPHALTAILEEIGCDAVSGPGLDDERRRAEHDQATGESPGAGSFAERRAGEAALPARGGGDEPPTRGLADQDGYGTG
ncbi:NACHT domain-containing protein [Saccharothrix saharensis]|uniref:NACHT domain-containing protein n=1 Tax=Saccharothrix saharensis TaxID=571190 RepID=UPI0014783BB5|nr:NACHT domain-containing protein [Saccharothrix saharensis]